jgi:hypothetical protein
MRRALLSLIFLVVLSSVAHADPIVITGGRANIVNPVGFPAFGNFSLFAPGFSAGGAGENRGGLTVINGSFFRGAFMSGDTSGSGTLLGTRLNFTLAPFELPDPGSSSNVAFVNTAFTMTGVVTVRALAPNLPILFTSEVSGSGFALITYQRNGPNSFIPSNITYFFGATEPIPEPATLVLLGTGLAGIAARVRRQRKNSGGA